MKPYFDLNDATAEEIEAKHQEALNEMYATGRGMLSPDQYSSMRSSFTNHGAFLSPLMAYLVCAALDLTVDPNWIFAVVMVVATLAIWFGVTQFFDRLFVEDASLKDSIFKNYQGMSTFKHLKK